jgi:hypothetical protein
MDTSLRPTTADPDGTAWAAEAPESAAMPQHEIRAVVTAEDPEVARRYLELHGERLEEELADRRRTLATVIRLLAGE